MVRILLTGGTGRLGIELLKLGADLIAPRRSELDITDASAVAKYVDRLSPDVIIHAAAVTDNRDIEADPSAALDVNIKGTVNLAQACLGSGARLVYISSDYVYKGDRGNYSESDEVLPSNLYAWTKLAGEAAVRAVANHLIIRTSFGASIFQYPAAFADKWSSKQYVDEVAPKILNAAVGSATGVLNIGGQRRTLYEYASERNPKVRKISRGEAPHDSTADSSLNLDRWADLDSRLDVVREVNACRICGSKDLLRYMDLGMMPLANSFADSADAARQMRRFPMQVQFCKDCSLSQLTVVIDPKKMFSNYAYRSSINKAYLKHCREMAKSVGELLRLGESDLVLDIAGNDGALLAEFKNELGVRVVNVDPARNLAEIAESHGVPTICEFWGPDIAAKVVEDHGRPRLITATNVFAHVDDMHVFVSAAQDCLHESGALMLEFPYCVDFIEQREFDTIYFEHLSYVLLEPLRRLVESLGMQIFDVQKQDIHGGTVRVFIARQGTHEVQSRVADLIAREKQDGYHDVSIYESWNRDTENLIGDLVRNLADLKKGGAKIAAFAASAKGNTLLNACRLDASTINYIVDDTPEKIGKFSPGNGIPIVDRDILASDAPDYLLILSWNFAREIIKVTADYGKRGGKYIIPIPSFRIIEAGDEANNGGVR
ncbi:MAG: sugar nucleotide-binding protein [Proteobacteria bacterium]|nr:sugar nucleotide-binding protein [Pseudomonadota bacterium]